MPAPGAPDPDLDLAAFDGAPLIQPSLFVSGSRDASPAWPADAIDADSVTRPGLISSDAATGFSRNAPPRSKGRGPRL
ncbi:hypothetical protein [Streptomyces aquilus]|uniref:hypothetical protein n=1 Tax=Streptomyces aquilus TaxID=2548456 RepID=UPI0036B6760C